MAAVRYIRKVQLRLLSISRGATVTTASIQMYEIEAARTHASLAFAARSSLTGAQDDRIAWSLIG